MRLISTLFISLILAVAMQGQPGFCGQAFSTFSSANIFFESSVDATLDGAPLPLGSYIIAVHGQVDIEGCAGFIQWEGQNSVMTVNGYDGNLPGYLANEPYRFLIQLPNGCLIDSIQVVYDTSGIFTNPGFFQDGTYSKVGVLQAWTSPWVTIAAQDGACGENTASIQLSPDELSAPHSVLWNTGDTTFTLANLSGGSYQATVTDHFGCVWTGGALVSNGSPLQILLETEVQEGGIDCQSAVVIASGTPPYTYSWSNGQSDSLATGLPEGSFSVLVTDSQGCTAQQSDECLIDALFDSPLPGTIRLYPNPSSGQVFAELNFWKEEQIVIRVSNLSGQEIWSGAFQGKQIHIRLELEGQPAGLYVVEVFAAEGKWLEKIWVK